MQQMTNQNRLGGSLHNSSGSGSGHLSGGGNKRSSGESKNEEMKNDGIKMAIREEAYVDYTPQMSNMPINY